MLSSRPHPSGSRTRSPLPTVSPARSAAAPANAEGGASGPSLFPSRDASNVLHRLSVRETASHGGIFGAGSDVGLSAETSRLGGHLLPPRTRRKSGSAAVERLGRPFGSARLGPNPVLGLVQQCPHLVEQRLRGAAVPLERLDPRESLHHFACLVHVHDASRGKRTCPFRLCDESATGRPPAARGPRPGAGARRATPRRAFL